MTVAAGTNAAVPKLSVGLPVYNGERFVGRAIESYLGQTFGDFDLVVCDNASTDETEAVCRGYAARDPRVKYFRNETNLGAAPNFNKAFRLARPTAYFKWTGADDEYHPTYLARCVEQLDRDPTVVLAHTFARVIDASGNTIPVAGGPGDAAGAVPPAAGSHAGGPGLRWADLYDRADRRLGSFSPAERFHDVVVRTRRCMEIWGVMRRAPLARTPLHGSFYGSDKVILTWLALAGRFALLAEPLYYRRHHAASSDSIKSVREREKWMDTRRAVARKAANPRVQCLRGYHRALVRAGLGPADQMRGYGSLAHYLVRPERWASMWREPK
jgi:glycosyltransferase involved in cell wall biosynthesis